MDSDKSVSSDVETGLGVTTVKMPTPNKRPLAAASPSNALVIGNNPHPSAVLKANGPGCHPREGICVPAALFALPTQHQKPLLLLGQFPAANP